MALSARAFYGAGNYLPKPPRKLTKDERQVIISTFHKIEEGKNGYLSREDLKVATIMLFGYKPSKVEIDQMIGSLSSDDHNMFQGISLDLFVALMTQKIAAKDEEDEIHQTFLTFDSQCRNFLTIDDLHRVFGQIAPHLPAHTIDTSFREIDRDGDGRVSYRDFEFMMKYNVEDGI